MMLMVCAAWQLCPLPTQCVAQCSCCLMTWACMQSSRVHACDNCTPLLPRRPRAGQVYIYMLCLLLSHVLLCCSWHAAA